MFFYSTFASITRLSQVCENGDIQSPTARNHSNRYKSNKYILKDLKRFVRFLSHSDTHY